MIVAKNLTKKYGAKVAVNDLSFTIKPGLVTGFLGPNGSGKSTTMRMIVGLDRPTHGSVTVDGKNYQQLAAPMTHVGALLEAKAVHKRRSAYHHLLAMAKTHGLPKSRVNEVISMVGLDEVAKKKAGDFSLGMGQRLGIAVALLGKPTTIILDEPVNGLDPEGVRWVRELLRYLADQGNTVFVSSHLMSEMALVADHLIVIGKGSLIRDSSMSELIAENSQQRYRIRSPRFRELIPVLEQMGAQIHDEGEDRFEVSDISAEEIGDAAAAAQVPLYELAAMQVSLEEAFMELTRDSVEYHASTAEGPGESDES